MILPYKYHDFTIEGFYEPNEDCTEMLFSASATHPNLEGVYSLDGFESWGQAKDAIETAIDELIASWN